MVGLDRGADALQRGDDALPGVGDARGVGRDEAQGGTAGQGLPQPQAGADAVGLGGGGGLADHGLSADLGSEGERARGEGFATAGGDRQLEAREKDADDHVSNTCSHPARTASRNLSQSRRSLVCTRVTALVEPRTDDPPGLTPAPQAGPVGGSGRGAVRRARRAAALLVPARDQDPRRGVGPVVGDVGARGRVALAHPREHARGAHRVRLHDRPQPARRLAPEGHGRAARARAARDRAAAHGRRRGRPRPATRSSTSSSSRPTSARRSACGCSRSSTTTRSPRGPGRPSPRSASASRED